MFCQYCKTDISIGVFEQLMKFETSKWYKMFPSLNTPSLAEWHTLAWDACSPDHSQLFHLVLCLQHQCHVNGLLLIKSKKETPAESINLSLILWEQLDTWTSWWWDISYFDWGHCCNGLWDQSDATLEHQSIKHESVSKLGLVIAAVEELKIKWCINYSWQQLAQSLLSPFTSYSCSCVVYIHG